MKKKTPNPKNRKIRTLLELGHSCHVTTRRSIHASVLIGRVYSISDMNQYCLPLIQE